MGNDAATLPVRLAAARLPNAVPIATPRYSLVHLVNGETTKNLILSQVVAPMLEQARTLGPLRPERVVIVFLEPARVALRRALRRRIAEIRRFAPDLKVALVPYVSRLGLRNGARIAAPLVRALVGRPDVVFHCRGEWSVLWAAHFAKPFRRSGIIADIRGSWPEEALAKRGVNDVEAAHPAIRCDYNLQVDTVKEALAVADEVLTVSSGMVDWLLQLGTDETHLHYVPSCVPALTFSNAVRDEVRARLGLRDELVYCFLGSAESYDTIGDGVAPFLRATFDQFADVRLLVVSDQPRVMRQRLRDSGLPEDKLFVESAAQGDVWRYLCAADCGCILKAPGRLNRTWQPIKLGEYLAAGLPVLVSRGVGKVDTLVTRAGAGIAIELFDGGAQSLLTQAEQVHDALRSDGAAMRERAMKLCREHFLWSCYIDEVRSAYVQALFA